MHDVPVSISRKKRHSGRAIVDDWKRWTKPSWSGLRGSNPSNWLGKPGHYHYAKPAPSAVSNAQVMRGQAAKKTGDVDCAVYHFLIRGCRQPTGHLTTSSPHATAGARADADRTTRGKSRLDSTPRRHGSGGAVAASVTAGCNR